MEISKVEVSVIEATARQVVPTLQELSELQLALVGGGIGDVIVA